MESVDDSANTVDASDDGEYRRFDFGAREHTVLREFTALSALQERQAELLEKAIDDAFSLEFELRPQAPSLLSVADALAGLDPAVAVTTTQLKPLQEPAYVVTSSSLLSLVVNAYFGGGVVAGPGDRAQLTPTELRLAERFAGLQLATMVTAWQDKLPLEASDAATLGVPDSLEMLPPSELLLRLAFTLRTGEFESWTCVLLPFADLEPYGARFAPPRRKADAEPTDSWEPYFRRELPGIEVELAAVLAEQPISLADLLELRTGSVLPLEPP
jgi:flagellar motor switch protein FliM